jgi:hypothetical protein
MVMAEIVPIAFIINTKKRGTMLVAKNMKPM